MSRHKSHSTVSTTSEPGSAAALTKQRAPSAPPPAPRLVTSRWSKAARIAILVLTVLGVHGYLWHAGIHMMLDSTTTPAKQLINATLERSHTTIYDMLKSPIMTSDTLGNPLPRTRLSPTKMLPVSGCRDFRGVAHTE